MLDNPDGVHRLETSITARSALVDLDAIRGTQRLALQIMLQRLENEHFRKCGICTVSVRPFAPPEGTLADSKAQRFE